MIKNAQGRHKLMVEELDMADVFIVHSLWDPDLKIPDINGGAENCDELNDDDSDSDELSDEPTVDKEVSSNKVGKEQMQSEQDYVIQLQETCIEDAAVLANSLENNSKHGLLGSSIFEKVQMSHISNKWLYSSGMPIYECVEKQDKRGKKQKQNQKSFTPFCRSTS